LLVKKIVPSKLEIKWLEPFSDTKMLDTIFEQIPEKIAEIKAFKGIGF